MNVLSLLRLTLSRVGVALRNLRFKTMTKSAGLQENKSATSWSLSSPLRFIQWSGRLPPWLESPWAQATLIFGLALLPRLFYLFNIPPEITQGDDPWYYLKLASGVLAGEGYHEANLLAYRPPMYPMFLATVFRLFGHSIFAVQAIQVLLSCVTCLLVWRLGMALGSQRAGLLGGVFCAVYPFLIHYSVQLWSEQLFTFFIVAGVYAFVRSEQASSNWWRVGSGVWLGLAALTRESGLLLLLALLVWLWWIYKKAGVAMAHWLPIAVCTACTILPWTIRNYVAFDHFVPIATNSGINFYMGNNPQATGTFNWVLAPGTEWNQPCEHGDKELKAASLGFQYGLTFIRENPFRSLELVGLRAYYLLRPPTAQLNLKESKLELASKMVWLAMYVVACFVAFIVGPFKLRRMGRPLIFLYLCLASLTLPYLVSYGATRYRLPMEPFIALAAALVALQVLQDRVPSS